MSAFAEYSQLGFTHSRHDAKGIHPHYIRSYTINGELYLLVSLTLLLVDGQRQGNRKPLYELVRYNGFWLSGSPHLKYSTAAK